MIQILGLFGMYFDAVVVEVKTFLLGSGHTVFDLGDLRRGSGKFFKNYIFESSAFQQKRMKYVTAFWSRLSLNLSTEEVW